MYEITTLLLDTMSVVSMETAYDDVIFNNCHQPINGVCVTSADPAYDKPEYSKHFFSSMGLDCNVMFSSGMITPVSNVSNFNNYNAYSRLRELFKTNDIKTGILIVEKYRLSINGNSFSGKSVVDYYLNNNNIAYDIDIEKDIARLVSKNMTKKGSVQNLTIRICHFIPEEILKQNHHVYHEESDSLLIYGVVSTDIISPNNKVYKKYVKEQEVNSMTNRNIITIDIIDDDVVQPYYAKVGNEVIKLLPSKPTGGNRGCTVSVNRNSVNVSESTVAIDELSNIGIYRSPELCVSEGDLKLKLENDKLVHETEKLVYSRDKLKADSEALVIEKDLTIAKYEHEIKMFNAKHEMMLLEIGKKKLDHELDFSSKMFNMKMEAHKTLLDLESKAIKHEYEMDKIVIEGRRNNIDNGFKTVNNLLITGKNLFK